MMTILPDVLDALIAYFMERDRVQARMEDGFSASPPPMQEQYPLAARIRQERDRYQREVADAVRSGLTVRNDLGAPIVDAWTRPDPVPLFVTPDDLKTWLASWLPDSDARAILRRLERPKEAANTGKVGRRRQGGPDDATLLKDYEDVQSRYMAQGVEGYAKKMGTEWPDRYKGITPGGVRQRIKRALKKNGTNSPKS